MTDRRALFHSLAERVEKLDGSNREIDYEIGQAMWDAGFSPWECFDYGRNRPARPFTASYDAIASLPGPEVTSVERGYYDNGTPFWAAYCDLPGGGKVCAVCGEAPTRLRAELAARLRGMAETLTDAATNERR